MSIPIVVLTSDHYLHALRPFSWLFNKYWCKEQEVYVVGFNQPDFELPDNFYFWSMGSMSNYPLGKWSNALIDYLNQHEDMHHFVLMLEDYWVTRPVNTQAVKMLHDYAMQFQNVLKIDLAADRLYAWGMKDYDNCGYLDLVVSDPASQYQMSLMCGIWSRELILRFLIRDESPWEVELNGTPRVAAAGNEVLVLGTRQWPVKHVLAHRRGNPSELLLDGIKAVDIESMSNLGMLF